MTTWLGIAVWLQSLCRVLPLIMAHHSHRSKFSDIKPRSGFEFGRRPLRAKWILVQLFLSARVFPGRGIVFVHPRKRNRNAKAPWILRLVSSCVHRVDQSVLHASEDPNKGWVWKDDYGWIREERHGILAIRFWVRLFFTQEPASHGGEEAGAVSSMVCAFVCFRCQGSR